MNEDLNITLDDFENLDDLFDDIDIDEDSSSDLDIYSQLENKEEDNFDGRFFISYLGLNPITMVKEDTKFVELLVRQNMESSRLKFLINNVDKFIKHVQNKIKNMESDEDRKESLEIINKLDAVNNSLRETLDIETTDLKSLDLNNNYGNNLEKILSSGVDTRNIYEEMMYNNIKEKDVVQKIGMIEKLLEKIYNLHKVMVEREDGDSSASIMQYKSRKYEYTDREKELLKILDFPTEIINNEYIFKYQLNMEMKPANTRIDNFNSKTLYNLLLNQAIVGNNKEKLLNYLK